MAITTYTEFRAEYDSVLDAMRTEQDAALTDHLGCLNVAEGRRDAVLNNPNASDDQKQLARDEYNRDEKQCKDKLSERAQEIHDHYVPLLAAIEQQARDGLARLPRLIIAWKDLQARAEAFKDVTWYSNTSATEPAPILTVQSFDELRATLEYDRLIDELLLVAKVDNKALLLGGERKTLSAIATDWGSTIAPLGHTRVTEQIYLRVELTGAQVDDYEPFRRMLGDPALNLAQFLLDEVLPDEWCFPPSIFVGEQKAQEFGKLVHQIVNADYCRTLGCTPRVNDYFDVDYPDAGAATEWRDFLIRHDPSLATPAGLALLEQIPGDRPDICTNFGTRKEYYQIKPKSPAGIQSGFNNLFTIMTYMNFLGQPYDKGRTYGDTKIEFLDATYAGIKLKLSFHVERHPVVTGLLMYRLCIEADLQRLLAVVSLAGFLALLLSEIGTIAAAILSGVRAGVAAAAVLAA
jgi:hypothetical protein